MSQSQPVPVTGELDLSLVEFWGRPRDERYAAFARMRELPSAPYFNEPESPFAPEGQGFYALVRHADIADASRNAEVFSSASGATSIPDLPPDFNEYFGSMINMDDPRHARLRRIVSRAFTPRMIKKFEEDVNKAAAVIVDDLLKAGPGGDFVRQVAARLPIKIICDMMGIGDDHYDMVLKNTNIILAGGDPEFVSNDNPDEFITQVLTAGGDLAALVEDLAAKRAQNPGDDLVTSLTSANIDGEALTPQELASFFILLVVAGNETTRNAITHALLLFTQHPDQRELLAADFEGRIGPAVEEIVRYVTPVIWMRRTLTRDYTLNGTEFREGDKVLLMYQAANRDPDAFTDPDRFDITRHPNPHVGFGGAGPHICLGAHLARREITVMLRELMQKVPQIRAAGEPDYLLSNFIHGIKHLTCDF